MNGSLQYLLVQKVAETEHHARIARAAYGSNASPVRVQLRRILRTFTLHWKSTHAPRVTNPGAPFADTSPC